MSVKHSIFIALLGIACHLHANTLPNSLPNIQLAQFEGGPCNAPAPVNFHVLNIGPTWVDLTWVSANPLDWYRIKTYRTSNNQMVSNLLIPPGNFATVAGLDKDEDYYSTINVVCENGEDSGDYARVEFHTVILELIVIGYENNGVNTQCTIRNNANNTCHFPVGGTVTNFRIRSISNPSLGRTFDVSKPSSSTRFRTTLKYNNLNERYKIRCDNQDPDTTGSLYQVLYANNLIATFTMSYSTPTSDGVLTCSYINPAFEIVEFESFQQFSPPPDGGDRTNSEDKANGFKGSAISIAPNPFSESLEIALGYRSESEVKIQLFNLSGQKVLEQEYEPGQAQYTLRTTGLSPGFYTLRVEADGEAKMLKVVKSE